MDHIEVRNDGHGLWRGNDIVPPRRYFRIRCNASILVWLTAPSVGLMSDINPAITQQAHKYGELVDVGIKVADKESSARQLLEGFLMASSKNVIGDFGCMPALCTLGVPVNDVP